MKQGIIAWALAASLLGQGSPSMDMSKLAETLRLGGTELKIENVTEREAGARKLPLKSAWIVSAPGHDLFFPLVVYTSAKGVLNGGKYDRLRKLMREKPPKEGKFGYELGFIEVPGIGECFVTMEEFGISSNRPAGVEGIHGPWLPTNKSGLSILGAIEAENLDFQIFLVFQDENKIGDFPEYKSMLYGPDFPKVKELSTALVEVVRDSKILTLEEARPDKRPGNESGRTNGNERAKPGSKRDAKLSVRNPDMNAADTGRPVWPWLLGMFGLLIALVLVRRSKR